MSSLRDVDFRASQLDSASFNRADLSGADFRDATLREANFREANLSGAYLREVDLSGANLRNAYFRGSVARATLISANLAGASFKDVDFTRGNLRGANLATASLARSDLSEVDLSGANLSRTDLRGASLVATNVTDANLSEACLTGACLKDWHTNRYTNLKGVHAEYIYADRALDPETGKVEFSNRVPHSGTFNSGEFTTFFHRSLNSIDISFTDGVDWKAFLSSFQALSEQYDTAELSLQSLENRDGVFIIRIAVLDEADKPSIEAYIKNKYLENLRHQKQNLESSNQEVSTTNSGGTTIRELISLLANSQELSISNSDDPRSLDRTIVTEKPNTSNYREKLGELSKLLRNLRNQARTFPNKYREDAFELMNDLENEIRKPEPSLAIVRRRLKLLLYIVSVLDIDFDTSTVSSILNDFIEDS